MGWWCIGCKKYLTEATCQIEIMFGDIHKKNTLMKDGYHTKVDTSIPPNAEEHQIYHILIGEMN